MKRICIALVLSAMLSLVAIPSATHAAANDTGAGAGSGASGDVIPELRLKDGRTLTDVVIREVLADGVKISHPNGGGRIAADILPDDLRARYGLDTPETERAANERRRREGAEARRISESMQGYPAICIALRKGILEAAAEQRTAMAQCGASLCARDRYEATQRALLQQLLDATAEAESAGVPPEVCMTWIRAALERRAVPCMPESFASIATRRI